MVVFLGPQVFAAHGLPVYYQQPVFHTSVAWAAEHDHHKLHEVCEQLGIEEDSFSCEEDVYRAYCRVGCKTYVIWQRRKQK